MQACACAGEYSAARLKELASQTKRLHGGSTKAPSAAVQAAEPAFKLSGSFKPAAAKSSSPSVMVQVCGLLAGRRLMYACL